MRRWKAHRVQVEDDSLGLYLHPADELCRCAVHSRKPEPAEHAHVQDSHPCTGDLLIVLQPAGEEQSPDGTFDEHGARALLEIDGLYLVQIDSSKWFRSFASVMPTSNENASSSLACDERCKKASLARL